MLCKNAVQIYTYFFEHAPQTRDFSCCVALFCLKEWCIDGVFGEERLARLIFFRTLQVTMSTILRTFAVQI
jgi:hypothetical protein